MPEIKNYYHLYLLQQVSRLNSHLNQLVKITDMREQGINKVTCQNVPWDGFNNLIKSGIRGIDHDILNQQSFLSMDVVVTSEQIFSDVIIDKHDENRYYYNERSVELEHGVPHQDRTHYLEANAKIGIPTQISNMTNLFKSKEDYGQSRNDYFKKAHRTRHAAEQALFKSAISNIQTGQPLNHDEKNVLENGKYYRYNSPVKFKPFNQKAISEKSEIESSCQITHVSHASEYFNFSNTVPLQLITDPIHYQTGTGGFANVIGMGGKILYDRLTDPAFATDAYPGVNVVWISHNHYDHLDERTIKEAFSQTNTLFIIPAGDGQYMDAWGISNYVEIGSWNDVVTIALKDRHNNVSQYEIRGLPANHASCRGTTDFFKSMYMGCLIRDLSQNNVNLCTGDTAVLKPEHFQELAAHLQKNNLIISTACIAHGPDRPRQWMECSHQSTADAITMHAEFTVMNAGLVKNLTLETLNEIACKGIGYHQGCYRLGLLSYSDVDTTLLRTFAVLLSLADTPIAVITEAVLLNNPFYNFMDKFEQDSLRNTLEVYKRLPLLDDVLTAKEIVNLIMSHLHIPQPGYCADFSKNASYEHFMFDYDRLLLNKNPCLKQYDEWNEAKMPAFEYFYYHLDMTKYKVINDQNKIELAIDILNLYLNRPSYNFLLKHDPAQIKSFLTKILNKQIDTHNLNEELGMLYSSSFPKQDEGIRDEGHSHTAITMLAGLLNFPDFCEKVYDRNRELHGVVSLEDGEEIHLPSVPDSDYSQKSYDTKRFG